MCAAVADWRPAQQDAQKIKKTAAGLQALALSENPDILASLGASEQRPRLLVGFAAETENMAAHASDKLQRKKCDWIIANNVSLDSNMAGTVAGGVMGGDDNHVTLFTADGEEDFGCLSKQATAEKLADKIAATLTDTPLRADERKKQKA